MVPRRQIAEWDPSRRPRPALEVLADQHALRDPELVPLRYGRMAVSPWTYLRGAAAVMAADLATRPHSGLTAQLCGDAHVLNFGLWASPERNLVFNVRDFDETMAGPFEWDLLRLVTSLVVLAREQGVPAGRARKAVLAATHAYRERMARYAAMGELEVWYDRIEVDHLLEDLEPAERGRLAARIERKARRRTNEGAFDQLTVVIDGRTRISEDPPRRYHDPAAHDEERVAAVMAAYRSTLPYHVHRLLDRFTITDVVRQVVGVGSVGMRVFLALLEGDSGRSPLFLQVKQAGPSVYEEHLGASPYPSHGARVVSGQRMMQSASDLFIGWTSVNGRDYYVRQLRDMKVVPDGAEMAPHLPELAATCGQTLAKAHARSGDPVAISAYIGKGNAFAEGVLGFATAYAHQTASDHADLVAAIASGAVAATPDTRR